MWTSAIEDQLVVGKLVEGRQESDDGIDMDSNSDQPVIAAANEFIANRQPGAVLNALYHRLRPADDDGLGPVADLLEIDEISVVRLIDGLNVTGLTCIVILSAALRRIRTKDAWIHYNLAKHLHALANAGDVEEAKLPAIVHSLLAIQGLKDSMAGATSFPLGILAEELGSFAPREAIRCGVLAVRHGNISGIKLAAASIEALNLEGAAEAPLITQSLTLSNALHFEADDIMQSASLGKIAGLQSTIVEPARTITLPSVSGDADHYIFARANKESRLPAISVHALESATYSVDATMRGLEQHYVFDKNGDCILELANGITPFIAETIMEFDEPVAILDDKFSGAMSICHFLLDGVTRIPIYERNHPKPGKFFIADGFPYYREIFERMGISERIIMPPVKRVSVRAPNILFSSNIAADFRHPAHLCAPWALDYLRTALRIHDRPVRKDKKIFISRADAIGRAILNWDEILPVLQHFGFDVVELTGMPAGAQIDLFSDASQVVGVHGAGLTNILFAPRDCAILEILPPLIATSAYWLLASSLGQHYAALIAEDAELTRPDYTTWQHNPGAFNQKDIVLPVTRFSLALAAL